MFLLAACGTENASPAGPTTTTATRVINLVGSLNLSAVRVGDSANGNFSNFSQGTAALTVSSIAYPCGSQLMATFASGVIPAGGSQSVTVTFRPTASNNCSGTVTVGSDSTAGTNTLAIIASGSLDGVPIFRRSGPGNTVFDLPTYVDRARIIGDYRQGRSNFIVRIAGQLVVNELVGTIVGQPYYDRTSLLPNGGGVVEITNNGLVAWSITEVR